ncbi:MAG TPA: hypothetical protein VHK88_13915 [Aquihabitans sp.]|nr:hypothetical protein [Aquihabitans sp.]
MAGEPELEQVEEIRLTLPAVAAYARVARLAVAGLATRVGFSYDEIEDLRIAVGEVCSLLLDAPGATGSRLVFRCEVSVAALRVEAGLEPPGPLGAVGDLSRQILTAVVDEVDLGTDPAAIVVVKRRRP